MLYCNLQSNTSNKTPSLSFISFFQLLFPKQHCILHVVNFNLSTMFFSLNTDISYLATFCIVCCFVELTDVVGCYLMDHAGICPLYHTIQMIRLRFQLFQTFCINLT